MPQDVVVDPSEVKGAELYLTLLGGELIYPWGGGISGGNLIREVGLEEEYCVYGVKGGGGGSCSCSWI